MLQTGNICDEDIIIVNHTVSTSTPTSTKNSAASSKPLAEMNDDEKPSPPVNHVKSEELEPLSSENGKPKYGNSPLPDSYLFPATFLLSFNRQLTMGLCCLCDGTLLMILVHFIWD